MASATVLLPALKISAWECQLLSISSSAHFHADSHCSALEPARELLLSEWSAG